MDLTVVKYVDDLVVCGPHARVGQSYVELRKVATIEVYDKLEVGVSQVLFGAQSHKGRERIRDSHWRSTA